MGQSVPAYFILRVPSLPLAVRFPCGGMVLYNTNPPPLIGPRVSDQCGNPSRGFLSFFLSLFFARLPTVYTEDRHQLTIDVRQQLPLYMLTTYYPRLSVQCKCDIPASKVNSPESISAVRVSLESLPADMCIRKLNPGSGLGMALHRLI
jgi:hypothetical protein